MGKRIAVALVCAMVLVAPMTASAASPWANGATWGDQAKGKLGYGLKNTLLGWTSLFRTPMQASQEGSNVFVGIGKGVWNAVGQTVGGVLHVVTFPITQIDVPLPQGGTEVLG